MQRYFGIEESDIILLGRSIGTGVAVHVAANRKPGAVILISPFTSIRNVAKHLVGRVSCMLRDRFNNEAIMEKVECPTLIIHGKLDNLIPWTQGEELSKLAPRCKFECPALMDHNKMSLNEVRNIMKRFLIENEL